MKKPISQRAVYQRAKRILEKQGKLLRKASVKDAPIQFYVINAENEVDCTFNSLADLGNSLGVIAGYEELEQD